MLRRAHYIREAMALAVNAQLISRKDNLSGLSPPVAVPYWAPPMSAPPAGRHRGHLLLGQHCCPNRPCQILPRHTRLVHAGTGKSIPFVAAALHNQQEQDHAARVCAMPLRHLQDRLGLKSCEEDCGLPIGHLVARLAEAAWAQKSAPEPPGRFHLAPELR